jgi:hypothetical protein
MVKLNIMTRRLEEFDFSIMLYEKLKLEIFENTDARLNLKIASFTDTEVSMKILLSNDIYQKMFVKKSIN